MHGEPEPELIQGPEQDGPSLSCSRRHIDRVQRLSSRLARLEGTSDDDSLQAIALAAVLHDVADWKYSGCGKAGPKAVKQFLDAHVPADSELTRDVLFVVANIGFKDGLDADAGRPNAPSARALTMLRCVQDADRLDALGAHAHAFRSYCARCHARSTFNRVVISSRYVLLSVVGTAPLADTATCCLHKLNAAPRLQVAL